MFLKPLPTALLGSSAAFALMAGPAMAGETEDLKAQIDQLRSRLDQLEGRQAATGSTIESERAAAPANAVVGGDFPVTLERH